MKILTIYMAGCCDKVFNTAEDCKKHEREHWKDKNKWEQELRKYYSDDDEQAGGLTCAT